MKAFLLKMKGGARRPPYVGFQEVLWSWFGSFVGIGTTSFINARYIEPGDLTLLIGSFGASAVLIYGAIKSPLAQPRNFIGGHVLSAFIGVTVYKMMGDTWLASGCAVSFAIAAMLLTGTLHPPGGATALIAVIGSGKIHSLGYFYILLPTLAGAFVMLVIALLVNNLATERRYPEYWF